MERRKVLLGSGAALMTALAGCSSDETSDDDEPSDDGSGSSTDDNGDNGDSDTDDSSEFDSDGFEISSDEVSVTEVGHEDDVVTIIAESEITDYEKLHAELEMLADDLDGAVDDMEAFADSFETIELTVDHDEKHVATYTIDVQWLVEYREEEISAEQFHGKIEGAAT